MISSLRKMPCSELVPRAGTLEVVGRSRRRRGAKKRLGPADFLVAAGRDPWVVQKTGWTAPPEAYPHGTAEVVPSVGALAGASGAKIRLGREMACYRIDSDHIEMPPLSAFTGSPTSSPTQGYAATLLHELVHWTGAAHRLDRGFGEGFDKEKLAAEELVAEIGAAYLCADLGVSNAPRPDHAAYVASWLKLLKNDRRAIFTASRLADRAATYLHDLAAAA